VFNPFRVVEAVTFSPPVSPVAIHITAFQAGDKKQYRVTIYCLPALLKANGWQAGKGN
jgi:hypothetical protein